MTGDHDQEHVNEALLLCLCQQAGHLLVLLMQLLYVVQVLGLIPLTQTDNMSRLQIDNTTL